MVCSEISVTKHHSTPRNIPEDRRSNLYHSVSLKSRIISSICLYLRGYAIYPLTYLSQKSSEIVPRFLEDFSTPVTFVLESEYEPTT